MEPTPAPRRRDYSGRVYKDRACAGCGTDFTPASATQQRCPACRPERRRALRRKREWDTCSVDGCDAKLRTSNTIGRCSEHRYVPAPRDVLCAADGCDKPLRRDNGTGYCEPHKFAKDREPARPCGAPGCERTIRADNSTGYCSDHAEPFWRTREYLDKRKADYRAQPKAPDVRRTCSVDGCERKIRSDNTTGHCIDHAYIPLDLPVCSVDGCEKHLNSRNAVGRCMEHRGGYWADDAPKCGEPGCGKTLHRDNASGLCKRHYDEAWKRRNNRAYYQRNQAALREYSRQYREVYAEEHRAYASAWNASNRMARLASDARRKLAAGAGMDDADRALSVARRLAIRHDACFYCGSPDTAHVDHYFPLAKGGTDRWVNLVRTCGLCNNAKYVMCGTAFLLLTGG